MAIIRFVLSLHGVGDGFRGDQLQEVFDPVSGSGDIGARRFPDRSRYLLQHDALVLDGLQRREVGVGAMRGRISRLAILFWVGYMGVVIGSALSRVSFDLFGAMIFVLGLFFGSLIVLLIGWVLSLLVNVLFGEPEDCILDFIWVVLVYWLGFFVGLFFRVI